jgi:hypothetical protein
VTITRRAIGLLRTGLGLWLAIAAGASTGSAAVAWRETGLSWAAAGWRADRGNIATQMTGAWHAEVAAGERWDGAIELAIARANDDRATLGPRVSGSALLRYAIGTRCLLQAGLRSAGVGDLAPRGRALASALGEPLLVMPEPDPARGARFHAGGVWGMTPLRDLRLFLAAGADAARRVTIEPGARLRAAPRLTLAGTAEWARGATDARVQVSLAREGRERIESTPIRSARTLTAIEVSGGRIVAPLRCEASMAFATTGMVSLPDPETYARWVDAGPAQLVCLGARVAPLRALRVGRVPLSPSLDVEWRRVMPHDLPVADGSSWRIAPGVAMDMGSRVYAVRAAWCAARLRGWDAGLTEGAETLRGWRLEASIRWRAPAVDDAAGNAAGDAVGGTTGGAPGGGGS